MNIKRFKLVDKSFLFVLLLILAFGLIVQSSASSGISSDQYYYVKKQLGAILIGVLTILFFIRYDYLQLRRFNYIIYGLSLLLLVLVLLFGQEVRGTTGWINLGPLPAVQPAEFTKIMLIVAFADFLSHRRGELNTLLQMLPCFIYMGIPFILIMLQPDMGTALVYVAITLVMMFIAGANPRILLGLIVSALALIILAVFMHQQYGMWIPLEDYQLKRLVIFLNPYEDGQGGRGIGWHTIQSLVAIGSGGLTGKGLHQGTQVQLNFLPDHHTDFIYAVIGEELGYIGATALILLYAFLLLRAIYISSISRELYGTLIVTGVSAMWLFHIFENIGMSIGLMPITGIPLPFVSYGGSAMLTNLVGVGLILAVNIRGKKIVF